MRKNANLIGPGDFDERERTAAAGEEGTGEQLVLAAGPGRLVGFEVPVRMREEGQTLLDRGDGLGRDEAIDLLPEVLAFGAQLLRLARGTAVPENAPDLLDPVQHFGERAVVRPKDAGAGGGRRGGHELDPG